MRLSDHIKAYFAIQKHRTALRLPTWVKYLYPRRPGESIRDWQIRRNVAKTAIQTLEANFQ